RNRAKERDRRCGDEKSAASHSGKQNWTKAESDRSALRIASGTKGQTVCRHGISECRVSSACAVSILERDQLLLSIQETDWRIVGDRAAALHSEIRGEQRRRRLSDDSSRDGCRDA